MCKGDGPLGELADVNEGDGRGLRFWPKQVRDRGLTHTTASRQLLRCFTLGS
jgi:hypothetical protein